jgi:hypothetical protein
VEQVVRALQGVFVLHLATVTASGAPLVAPIDGLFYRGRVWFGVPPGAVRIQHIRARPQVSAVHSVGGIPSTGRTWATAARSTAPHGIIGRSAIATERARDLLRGSSRGACTQWRPPQRFSHNRSCVLFSVRSMRKRRRPTSRR